MRPYESLRQSSASGRKIGDRSVERVELSSDRSNVGLDLGYGRKTRHGKRGKEEEGRRNSHFVNVSWSGDGCDGKTGELRIFSFILYCKVPYGRVQ